MKGELTTLVIVFGMALAIAQNTIDSARHDDTQRLTVVGCIGTAGPKFVLVTATGDSYRLAEGKREIKFNEHLGAEVEVTGWESRSMSTRTETLGQRNNPETIVVTAIKKIEDSCPLEPEDALNPHRSRNVLAR